MAAADQVEDIKANTVGGSGVKTVPAVSQSCPSSGSPLVDLVDDTDSDDCELERKKEEAAVELAMRQDTQIMGRNIQGSQMQQEKRKMGCYSPTASKKFRQDSSGRVGNPEFMGKKKQGVSLGPSLEGHSKFQKLLSTSELAA